MRFFTFFLLVFKDLNWRNTMKAEKWGIPLVLTVLALVFLAPGCSSPREAQGMLDTPEHHVLRGNDFLDQEKFTEALREFDLALTLDKGFPLARAGKAIVLAHRSRQGARFNKSQAKDAISMVDDALDDAKSKDDERKINVSFIRVYRWAKYPKDWLGEAEDHFKDAMKLNKEEKSADPHFFMARAYRDAFKLRKSMDHYRDVLDLDKKRTQMADKEMALVQRVDRARPGTRYGKIVAFAPSLSKADVAALFIEELRLDKLYERGNSMPDNSFSAPGAVKRDRLTKATDVRSHPLRSDIELILKLGVVGLEPSPQGHFEPNAKVTRAEFAMMLEDVLMKVTGETNIKTRYIGQKSHHPDVRNDLPYFNAVETVTSRNLMLPTNKVRGYFSPGKPVVGADALLAIRVMKDELKSVVR